MCSPTKLLAREDDKPEATNGSSKPSKELPERYQPTPVIRQTTILLIGVFLFLLAQLWPPLILFVAYGLSVLIPYSFRTNDAANQRRILFEEFRQQSWLPQDYRIPPQGIQVKESYWVNQRGMCLQTSVMEPTNVPVKAVVCFLHGFTDHSSFMKRVEHYRMVRQGIAVVYIEIEGHGRSDGPLGEIRDWEIMANDVRDFFAEVKKERFHGKPFFLMGESMGGAICYSVYNLQPDMFRGVVFQAPMCKISEKLMPPKIVVDILRKLVDPKSITSFLGYLPITPTDGHIADYLGQNKESLAIMDSSPTLFARRPRLGTGFTLLNVTTKISASLSEFDAPFLVQHGSADKVTDPQLSQALYDEASSKDKTIRIYDGMWHSLTHGESEENKDLVFKEAIEWILERSKVAKD